VYVYILFLRHAKYIFMKRKEFLQKMTLKEPLKRGKPKGHLEHERERKTRGNKEGHHTTTTTQEMKNLS
jgi:hypothetical protein